MSSSDRGGRSFNCAVLQARTRYAPSEIAQQENGDRTFNTAARSFPSIRLRGIKYIFTTTKKFIQTIKIRQKRTRETERQTERQREE